MTNIPMEMIFDVALILISGLAVLYCWLLSRRLKRLQSLETGLGASIVELTNAISQTNAAALEARASTVETVQTLKKLLTNVEDSLPLADARLESLRNSQKSARQTSQSLLKIMKEIKKYETKKKSLMQQTNKTSAP